MPKTSSTFLLLSFYLSSTYPLLSFYLSSTKSHKIDTNHVSILFESSTLLILNSRIIATFL